MSSHLQGLPFGNQGLTTGAGAEFAVKKLFHPSQQFNCERGIPYGFTNALILLLPIFFATLLDSFCFIIATIFEEMFSPPQPSAQEGFVKGRKRFD